MVFTCFRAAPNYPHLKPFESLLMYLETFGCITNKCIVISLSSGWLLAIETINRTPLIPQGTIVTTERPKPLTLALLHISRLNPESFFSRLRIQLHKLRSQLWGSFFIWHSFVSSGASLRSQTIVTSLLTNTLCRMLITCSQHGDNYKRLHIQVVWASCD